MSVKKADSTAGYVTSLLADLFEITVDLNDLPRKCEEVTCQPNTLIFSGANSILLPSFLFSKMISSMMIRNVVKNDCCSNPLHHAIFSTSVHLTENISQEVLNLLLELVLRGNVSKLPKDVMESLSKVCSTLGFSTTHCRQNQTTEVPSVKNMVRIEALVNKDNGTELQLAKRVHNVSESRPNDENGRKMQRVSFIERAASFEEEIAGVPPLSPKKKMEISRSPLLVELCTSDEELNECIGPLKKKCNICDKTFTVTRVADHIRFADHINSHFVSASQSVKESMTDRKPCSLEERRPKSILKRSTFQAPQPPRGILKLASKPVVCQKSSLNTPDPINCSAGTGSPVSKPRSIPVADIAQESKIATSNHIENTRDRDTHTPPGMAVATVGKKAIHKIKCKPIGLLEHLGDQVYDAEKITDKRLKNGKTEYLVKWKGYSSSKSTWEPEENLFDPRLMQQFLVKEQNKIVKKPKPPPEEKKRGRKPTCVKQKEQTQGAGKDS